MPHQSHSIWYHYPNFAAPLNASKAQRISLSIQSCSWNKQQWHCAVPTEPRGRIETETFTTAVTACQHSLPILRNFRRDILAREIDIYRRMEQVDKQTSLRLPPYLGYPAGSRLQCVIYGSRKQSEDGHLRIAFERLQGEPQTARR